MKLRNGFSRRSFILSAGVSALVSGGCAEYSNVSELGADAATGSERDLFSRSEAAFAKASRRGLPGAIIAVQRGEEPAQIRAYGLADVDDALPMQTEMWMRIGSVSKLFVGYIVLKLIDEGVLDLDQPVSDFRNDVPSADKITLLMLGNHTSGLFNPIYSKKFRTKINQSPSRRISREEMFETAWSDTELPQQIGVFRYSNANTALLADIAERATGQKISALLQKYVLSPVEVQGLRFADDHTLPEPSARGYRFGPAGGGVEYGRHFFDATDFSASWADAAGDMQAQADTLLRAALYVVKAANIDAGIVARQRNFIDVRSDFGYGFCLANYNGWLGHAGDVPGFSAFTGWKPDENISLVVLTNLSNFKDGSSPADELRNSIFAA